MAMPRPVCRALVAGIALALVACGGRGATPTPATAPGTPVATATAPRASATPTPTPSVSPTARATVAPAPLPTAPAGPTPPAGYADSCAADHPWGVQVSAPFVCIDAPAPATVVDRGAALPVRGYAGGSFENNVVVQIRAVAADGSTAPGTMASVPLTYVAPDLGMPGSWATTIDLAASGLPATWRVVAFFTSPKDGSVVASTSVDFTTR